jgi:hypothetical protein
MLSSMYMAQIDRYIFSPLTQLSFHGNERYIILNVLYLIICIVLFSFQSSQFIAEVVEELPGRNQPFIAIRGSIKETGSRSRGWTDFLPNWKRKRHCVVMMMAFHYILMHRSIRILTPPPPQGSTPIWIPFPMIYSLFAFFSPV